MGAEWLRSRRIVRMTSVTNEVHTDAMQAIRTWNGAPLGQLVSAALGLGCWIATLLAYSVSITPFQRFDGLETFIHQLPSALHLCGIAACLVLTLASMREHFLSNRTLIVGGAALHTIGCAVFAYLAISGLPTLGSTGLKVLIWLLALVLSAGMVCTALAWGRAIKRFGIRSALLVIAVASLVSAGIELLLLLVSSSITAAVAFAACALGAGLLPARVGMGAARDNPPESTKKHSSIRSLLSVGAPALFGLVLFAYIMALMGARIVDTYAIELGTLVFVALVVGALALWRTRTHLLPIAYRSLVPVCAVVALAVVGVVPALGLGQGVSFASVFALYNLAALLALGTLAAMAHANEFASDTIFLVALGLFCLATFVGFKSDSLRANLTVAIIVITALYAAGTVVITTVRQARHDTLDRKAVLNDGHDELETLLTHSAPAPSATSFEQRCTLVAQRYQLTAREAEVLAILAEGRSCNYASEALIISPSTARTHAHNIYAKLGVASREELMAVVREAKPAV